MQPPRYEALAIEVFQMFLAGVNRNFHAIAALGWLHAARGECLFHGVGLGRRSFAKVGGVVYSGPFGPFLINALGLPWSFP